MESLSTPAVISSIIQSVASAVITLVPVLLATFSSRKELGGKLDKNIQSTSLLLMHDEHLSLEGRIAAGDQFITAGGNGAGKTFHQELIRQYNEQLKARGTE
jgi:hypothetical protein